MITLYFVPNSRATRPRWLLEELGVPYELHRVDVKGGENKTDAYRAIQPLGHVPALADDGHVMFESMAILLYLADKYAEKKLAPAPWAPERMHYLQWMAYGMTELEPALIPLAAEVRKPEAERNGAALEKAKTRFHDALVPIEKVLSERPFLLGAEFSAVDILIAGLLAWGRSLGALEGVPACAEYSKRCMSRPAAKAAREP